MKRILITGADSYVGGCFETYLKKNYPGKYIVDSVDMRGDDWRNKDFSRYDSVFHVAGIAHADSGKISKERARLYYAVNTEIAIETAQKASKDGVGQFVFMSSAIVYGNSASIGQKKVIYRDTPVSPANCYGDSKVQAENGLRLLDSDHFRVVILRSPMIYGKGSKGNYPLLAKLARKTPVFPWVDNERSMIYIENLCEFVRLMIQNEERGTFWPQNAEYSNTSQLVRMIGEVNGRKIRLVKGVVWMLRLLSHVSGLVNKAFGSMSYEKELSQYQQEYAKVSLMESIRRSGESEKV